MFGGAHLSSTLLRVEVPGVRHKPLRPEEEFHICETLLMVGHYTLVEFLARLGLCFSYLSQYGLSVFVREQLFN